MIPPGDDVAAKPGAGSATLACRLDRAALVATLVLPLFLMHGRGVADGLIAAIGLALLGRSAAARDWAWLRTPWIGIGLAWWVWLVVCSLPGIGEGGASLVQALATLRFLLFVAALDHVVLRAARSRRLLGRVLAVTAAYIAAQSLLQFATGHNLYGHGRGIDGELTGPFDKPRAAAPLSRLLPPVLLPPVARLRDRPDLAARLASAALVLGGIFTMVLIGQRMPLLLTGFGFAIAGLLLPRLRDIVLGGGLAGVALLGATIVISPPTYHRLVEKFATQMGSFTDSHYGEIAARALAIARAHPWTGRGFDGFRSGCADPRYFQGWLPGSDGGGAVICTIHPHNFYLQAVTDSGLPGLALFCALVLVWLMTLARGLRRRPDPLRVGLFVSALMQLWPVASTSSFTAIELSGFSFLLLGWGLAETRARS